MQASSGDAPENSLLQRGWLQVWRRLMSSFHLPLLTPHPRSGSPTHLSPRREGKEQGALLKATANIRQPCAPPQGLLSSLNYTSYTSRRLSHPGQPAPLTLPRTIGPGPLSGTTQRGYQKEATEKSYSLSRRAPPGERVIGHGVLSSLRGAVTHSSAPPHAPLLPVSSCRSPSATPVGGHLSPQP